jgi:hypothetical protein
MPKRFRKSRRENNEKSPFRELASLELLIRPSS